VTSDRGGRPCATHSNEEHEQFVETERVEAGKAWIGARAVQPEALRNSGDLGSQSIDVAVEIGDQRTLMI
jgi:hypothetical protein